MTKAIPEETTSPMTPNQLLEGYSYAVIRFGYDNIPLVSDLFVLESSANEYCEHMNEYVDRPDDESSVVRIVNDESTSQVARELNETRAALEDVIASVDLTIDHIVRQCERLCDKNVGKRFKNMDRSQFVSYECDRAAYNELANVLAFLRGATNHMSDVEVPEVPAFPNPEL